MLLENERIEMKWSNRNRLVYEQRGYIFTKNKDVFFPLVKDAVELSDGVKVPVKCDYCGKIYYPTARNYLKVKNRNEKDCCVSCKGAKIKETNLKKYGTANVMQVEEIKGRHQNICLEKFGSTSPLGNKDIYKKTQDSFNQHFGTLNGIKDIRKVKEIVDKIENTNKEKFGGISPFCSKKVRRKAREAYGKNGKCPTSKKQIQVYEQIKKYTGTVN